MRFCLLPRPHPSCGAARTKQHTTLKSPFTMGRKLVWSMQPDALTKLALDRSLGDLYRGQIVPGRAPWLSPLVGIFYIWLRPLSNGLSTSFRTVPASPPRPSATRCFRNSSKCISGRCACLSSIPWKKPGRSEEHTSELQSLLRISYAVICLTKTDNFV